MVDYLALAGWWVHPITIERFTGVDAYGRKQYATPVTINGWVDDTRRLVRNSDGDEVVSETSVFLPPGTDPVPLDSRATLPPTHGSRQTTVLAVSVRHGGGQPTPDHVELALA